MNLKDAKIDGTINHQLFIQELKEDEYIQWIGKPNLKALKVRNIIWGIFSYVNIILAVVGTFLFVYAIGYRYNKTFFPEADIITLKIAAIVFLLILLYNIYQIFKKSKYLSYCLTNKRLLIYPKEKNKGLRIIKLEDIEKCKIAGSSTDRENGVSTIKLMIKVDEKAEDEVDKELYLESIEDGDKVLELIKKTSPNIML
jgi:hypothetical protein